MEQVVAPPIAPTLASNPGDEFAGPPDLIATAPTESRPTPTQNVTINLINRLVQKGVLSKEDADDLIKQAEADVIIARQQTAAAAVEAVAQVAPAPPTGDSIRVTYIPEVVKAQMREEIKTAVMAKAREESWAAPRSMPEWTTRIKLFGDLRVRGEGLYYPDGNDNTGAFPNFNAINTGSPFDTSGTVFSPQYNVDRDRQRIRLRARVGLAADLGENFSAGMRIATGENNSPVTTNQSLGVANGGQGGNFSKYAIWLDRAFVKYEIGGQTDRNFAVSIGRFENPFFSTPLVWDDDVGFDGIALQAKYEVLKGFKPFIAGGAFPVFNSALNFASNQPSKFASYDKWLYGGQAGADWKMRKDLNFKVGGAYYYFDNIEGRLSDPYTPLNNQDAGNTDESRPAFAQKGNTYMALRQIVPSALNNFGTTNQFQYFGLATPFHELAFTGRLDYSHFEPFNIALTGEYVRNLAFDAANINSKAVNNRGVDSAGGLAPYAGGDTAWNIDLKLGSATLQNRWDWNVSMGYRHIESDAVVDGFVDSDFGDGGTNVRGYTVGGVLALSRAVTIGFRWFSANEIVGPPLKSDAFQLDFSAKF